MTRAGVLFRFYVYDEEFTYGLAKSLEWNRMLIPGSQVNAPEGDDVCYLALFNHGLPSDKRDMVILGNLFLEKYYLVYDMSPLESGKEYI